MTYFSPKMFSEMYFHQPETVLEGVAHCWLASFAGKQRPLASKNTPVDICRLLSTQYQALQGAAEDTYLHDPRC